ncbi:MAG: polysaccharide biosynthesis/export family protein [Dongiaceae bacterium]
MDKKAKLPMEPCGKMGSLMSARFKFPTLIVAMIMANSAALGLMATSATAAEVAYRLNPGDGLNVSVWKEEDLDREVVVLPDGMIAFPLVGSLATGICSLATGI